jgi:glucose-1-phosphate cytidylyltransferase
LRAPPVVILCGGRGTRLREHTQELPKPLVEIGGMPIVWHVIQLYAVQGFSRFLLATGCMGKLIEGFVAAHSWPRGVAIECVDTGPDTQTGGRIKRTQLDGDGRVLGFQEKPRSEHWINGGFFCFGAGAWDYLEPNSVLERAPLERMAADGQLRAHRHEGFWECMDTYKDAVQLNDLWASGEAPWRMWD